MTKISATIVADSKAPSGDRLTTMLVTFPRFILAELNTHRMLSKNSASSRAIPFNTMVKSVQDNPFIPIAWQKEHKGMQGSTYITNEEEIAINIRDWHRAKIDAIRNAEILTNSGVTKQLSNRLLEPFMWHTVLITATEWENFFNLRCPQYITPVMGEGFYAKSWKDLIKNHSDKVNLQLLEDNKDNTLLKLQHNKGQAEIHMMALAEAMWGAMNESIPKELKAGEWHIPFEDKINLGAERPIENMSYEKGVEITKVKISTAMAARTSYTIVGDEKEFGYEKQIELHDRLTTSGHYSPFEHCARVMTDKEYRGWVKGQDISTLGINIFDTDSKGWCRNYRGFIQYREILEDAKQKK